jgi:hypothetical protein
MTPPNPGGDQTRSGATPCRRTAGRHPRRCWRPLSLDAGCIPSPGRRVPAISSPLDQNYQQGHSRCGVGRLSAWAGEPGHRLVAGLPASKDQQPDTIPVAAPTMPIPMAAGSPSRLAPGAGAGRARTIGKVLGSRPGREILPRLRPGIPLRGWRGAGGAGASAEGERVRRTMGPRRPRRVPDWLLIVGPGHLEQVLRIYVKQYNEHRPRRALGLEAPGPPAGRAVVGEDETGWVRRRDLFCGLLQEYHRGA